MRKNAEKPLEATNHLNAKITRLFTSDHTHQVLIERFLTVIKPSVFLDIRFIFLFVDPSSASASEGIGSKLMKKHGWQEGQGLGRKLQGRADPLQVCCFSS